MMEPIRTLVADDELVALRGVGRLLQRAPDIRLIGEARTGKEAVEIIRAERPELLFLDVQMPDLDGLGCMAELAPEERPVTVFVTAYERYALPAFDVQATDYLLKPFSDARFHAALERAREQVALRRMRAGAGSAAFAGGVPGAGDATVAADGMGGAAGVGAPAAAGAVATASAAEHAGVATPAAPAERHLSRLLVRRGERMTFVPVEEIDWIAARDYCVEVHAGRESHVLRESLAELERRLDPERFVRVHRSAIVNLLQVREIQPFFNGQYVLILRSGARVMVSRRRRAALERALGQRL
ncbi:MAG TPA: LytTR family DNA-binding domain-containing protein [Longimicrobiales bacterium]|nr:LytTR family DNA-binding domain-containing protein [Longimicrobiales bacterium]